MMALKLTKETRQLLPSISKVSPVKVAASLSEWFANKQTDPRPPLFKALRANMKVGAR